MVRHEGRNLHHRLRVVDRRVFVAAPQGLNLRRDVATGVEDREVFLPWDAPTQDHSAEAFLAHGEKLLHHAVDLLPLRGAAGLALRIRFAQDAARLRHIVDEFLGVARFDLAAKEVFRRRHHHLVFLDLVLVCGVVENFVRAVQVDAQVRVDRCREPWLQDACFLERPREGGDVLGHFLDRFGDLGGKPSQRLGLLDLEGFAVLRHVGSLLRVRGLLVDLAESLDLGALRLGERVVEVAQRRVHHIGRRLLPRLASGFHRIDEFVHGDVHHALLRPDLHIALAPQVASPFVQVAVGREQPAFFVGAARKSRLGLRARELGDHLLRIACGGENSVFQRDVFAGIRLSCFALFGG